MHVYNNCEYGFFSSVTEFALECREKQNPGLFGTKVSLSAVRGLTLVTLSAQRKISMPSDTIKSVHFWPAKEYREKTAKRIRFSTPSEDHSAFSKSHN